MEIELRKVNKTYKNGKVALQNINLTLTGPRMIGLVGPNGAGKSTLMKLLTANLLPTSGEIMLNGRPLRSQETALKASLGYLPQAFGLFEDLKVSDFLTYMATLKGISRKKTPSEVEKVIERTNLNEKSRAKIKTLSGGQKQRIGIAQALLGDPKLVIFDEPTVGLDPAERVAFRALFTEEAKDRMVVLSTHIIEDIQSICDHLIAVEGGTVLYEGKPQALMAEKNVTTLEKAYMSLFEGRKTDEADYSIC